jgi:hypothetical protein
LPSCAEIELPGGSFTPNECRLTANGEALHVRFARLADGADAGAVSIDVIGEAGGVRQVVLESGVSEYLVPRLQDIDGDSRADILMGRETGNVNTVSGVWIFSGEGLYRRAGEVSGFAMERTDNGLVAVSSRSSAVGSNVAFYALDEAGLHLIASVNVDMDEGDGSSCTLADAPGLAALLLSPEQAQAKFCAEPAVGASAP